MLQWRIFSKIIRIRARKSELQAKSPSYGPKVRVTAGQTLRIRSESPRKGRRRGFRQVLRQKRPLNPSTKIKRLLMPVEYHDPALGLAAPLRFGQLGTIPDPLFLVFLVEKTRISELVCAATSAAHLLTRLRLHSCNSIFTELRCHLRNCSRKEAQKTLPKITLAIA